MLFTIVTLSETVQISMSIVHVKILSPYIKLQACAVFKLLSEKVIGFGADHVPIPPGGTSLAARLTHSSQTAV